MVSTPCRNLACASKVLAILFSTTVLLVGRGGVVVHGFSIDHSDKRTTTRRMSNGVTSLKESNSIHTPGKSPVPWLPILSSAILSMSLVAAPFPAHATSNAAAQISLDSLPPTSISIQIQDLPVVGNLLSGTYSKVPDGSIAKPSIVIKSPKDKIKAISTLATTGHLEFDINGNILTTHLDVDVAADEAGKANVVVQSNLIPKLPFKNVASSSSSSKQIGGGGKESVWSVVTNMGNGESYYFNAKTGDTQFERPERI
jgi:hypothetical protein